jgi:uncharacterized membrane protein YgdD (TMEM256/DUF423 family)
MNRNHSGGDAPPGGQKTSLGGAVMPFAFMGGLFGFLSVALGAFATHVLEGRLSSAMVDVFRTGAQYQMYHALALIAVGILLRLDIGGRLMRVAGWLFAIGIVLFSGSLYALSTSGITKLGAMTPIGGLCFLVGWVCFMLGTARGVSR